MKRCIKRTEKVYVRRAVHRCIASIRYLAGNGTVTYGNFEIYYFHVKHLKHLFPLLFKLSTAGHASLTYTQGTAAYAL